MTPFLSPADWRRPALIKRDDWIHVLEPEEIAEIEAALAGARAHGVTLASLTRENFKLTAFPRIVEKTRYLLEHGPGMVLIRGFPSERFNAADLRMIYWGLGKYLGTAISQSAEGDVLGDVRDLGVDLSGPKGRGYKTNAELEFHTDSCDVVALMVLRTAQAGGMTMIASSVAIHNEMLRVREHSSLGRLLEARHPVRFSKTPVTVTPMAPSLGVHTEEILAELGRSVDDIAQLRSSGVIA